MTAAVAEWGNTGEMPGKRRGERGAGAGMDTIAKTIKRLVKREYDRPAPKHFQRAARELLRWASKTMRDSLEAEASKGQKIPLSKTAIGHFPIEDWDWGAPSEPVLTSTVEHFKRELPLVVRTLPDTFAVDVPRNTYLTLARGAVHWYKDTPGPLTAYHLYLTPEEVEELKRIEEKWRRELFISTKYISHSLYSTSWPLTWYGVDYKRTLDVSFGPIQVQEARRWAHLVVSFHVSTIRAEVPSMGPDGKIEPQPVPPPELTAEELAPHIAELEEVLAGKKTEPAQQGQLELIPPKTFNAPAHIMEKAHLIGRRSDSGALTVLKKHPLFDGFDAEIVADWVAQQEAGSLSLRPFADDFILGIQKGMPFLDEERKILDDAARMGELSMDLGPLGMRVYLALLHIAERQLGMTGHKGRVVLRNWFELCREIYPSFDMLEKPAKDACRRRVKRVVVIMRRTTLIYSYRRPNMKQVRDKETRAKKWVRFTEEHFVNASWVSKWENVRVNNRRSHSIIIELGVYDDDYPKAIATLILAIVADPRMSDNAQFLIFRLLRESWHHENRSVAKLIEWGGWKSKDDKQNRASLAEALALYVKLGYLEKAQLFQGDEKYYLVKHLNHYFPAKQIEAGKAAPGITSGEAPEGVEAKKAYPGKRSPEEGPGGGGSIKSIPL